MRNVSVEYGDAHTYWDAFFTPKLCENVGVDHEMMPHISVFIDPDTGEVSLNRGYVERSPQGNAEDALYAEYSEDIEHALFERLSRRERPEYAAFVARMRAAAPSPR